MKKTSLALLTLASVLLIAAQTTPRSDSSVHGPVSAHFTLLGDESTPGVLSHPLVMELATTVSPLVDPSNLTSTLTNVREYLADAYPGTAEQIQWYYKYQYDGDVIKPVCCYIARFTATNAAGDVGIVDITRDTERPD